MTTSTVRPGDVVTHLNGEPVESDAVQQILEANMSRQVTLKRWVPSVWSSSKESARKSPGSTTSLQSILRQPETSRFLFAASTTSPTPASNTTPLGERPSDTTTPPTRNSSSSTEHVLQSPETKMLDSIVRDYEHEAHLRATMLQELVETVGRSGETPTGKLHTTLRRDRVLQSKDETIASLEERVAVLSQELHELKEQASAPPQDQQPVQQVIWLQQELSSERERFCDLQELYDLKSSKLVNLETNSSAQVDRLYRSLNLKDQQLSETDVAMNRLDTDLKCTLERLREKEDLIESLRSEKQQSDEELNCLRTQVQESLEQKRLCMEQLLRDLEISKNVSVEKGNQIVDLKLKLDSSQSMNSSLSQELETTKMALADSMTTVDTLQKQSQERELEIHSKCESLIKSNVKVVEQKLDEERIKATRQIADLNQHVNSLQTAQHISSREVESLESLNADLSSRISKLHDALEEKETALSEARSQVFGLQGEVEDLRSDVERCHDELAAQNNKLSRAEKEYASLSNSFSKLTETSTKERETHSAQIIELQNKCSDLQSRNSDIDKLLRSLRRTAAESESRFTNAHEELLRERESFKKVHQTLSLDYSALEQEATHLRQTVRSLEDQLVDATGKLASVSKAFDSNKARVTLLEGEIASRDEQHHIEIKSFENRLLNEQKRVSQANTKLADSDATVGRLRTVILQNEKMIEEERQKATLDAELRQKKQLEWFQAKSSELNDVSTSAESLREAKLEATRLQEALVRSQEEVDRLTGLTDKLREEALQNADQFTEAHKSVVDRISFERKNLQEALQESEKERRQLVQQLNSVEEGAVSTRHEYEALLRRNEELTKSLRTTTENMARAQGEVERLEKEKLEISSDSSNGEFSNASRADLKHLCVQLRQEMAVVERRAKDAVDDAARRATHVDRLGLDLEAMSSSIDKLVKANEMLDSCLQETRVEKSAAVEEASSMAMRCQELESNEVKLREEKEKLRKETIRHADERSLLNGTINDIKEKHQAEVERLTATTTSLGSELDASRTQNTSLLQEVSTLREQLSDVESRKCRSSDLVSEMEQRLADLSSELTMAHTEKEAACKELEANVRGLNGQIESYKVENNLLVNKLAELEIELGSQRFELKICEEKLQGVTSRTEVRELELKKCEEKRRESEMKLASATGIVSEQSTTISALKRRVVDTEHESVLLSEQVKRLESTLRDIEESSENNGYRRSKQVETLEAKCLAIEQDRTSLRECVSSLKGEISHLKQDRTEQERVNASLLGRVENLKETLASCKRQLDNVLLEKENAISTTRSLQQELESKQMETGHLKANLNMANAAVARMKSEHAMLQEAALGQELRSASLNDRDKQNAALKAELDKMASQVSMLQSRPMLNVRAHSRDAKLLDFVTVCIEKALAGYRETLAVVNQLSPDHVSRNIRSKALVALDLDVRHSSKRNDLVATVSRLGAILPQAISYFEAKSAQLKVWMENTHSSPRTPKVDPVSSDFLSPGIVDAWQKMKTVLQDEVITPRKLQRQISREIGTGHLQAVIETLEGQIDALLNDLKAANEALKTKDQLFADMEHLISYHEAERDRLQKEVNALNVMINSYQERLTRESNSAKDTADAKKSAILFAASVLDKRWDVAKATAFRQWYCQSTALRVIIQQGEDASALAFQLETTREKLAVLKRHLKKSRRGRESSLDRIMEGSETT